MKKQAKKLTLAKETVRRLETMSSGRVVGGLSEGCGATATNCNACTYENSCLRYCVDEPITAETC
jgi:hypothetical protein